MLTGLPTGSGWACISKLYRGVAEVELQVLELKKQPTPASFHVMAVCLFLTNTFYTYVANKNLKKYLIVESTCDVERDEEETYIKTGSPLNTTYLLVPPLMRVGWHLSWFISGSEGDTSIASKKQALVFSLCVCVYSIRASSLVAKLA
jgi:hypothetical protein